MSVSSSEGLWLVGLMMTGKFQTSRSCVKLCCDMYVYQYVEWVLPVAIIPTPRIFSEPRHKRGENPEILTRGRQGVKICPGLGFGFLGGRVGWGAGCNCGPLPPYMKGCLAPLFLPPTPLHPPTLSSTRSHSPPARAAPTTKNLLHPIPHARMHIPARHCQLLVKI